MNIERNHVVSFHYSMSGDSGDVVESSREGDPIAVLQGHGNVIRGVDDALLGHGVGDRFQVTVPPEQAYGLRLDAPPQRVPKKRLSGPRRLRPGDLVTLHTSEGARDVTVVKVGRTVADVDLNHPLAGQTLTVDIEITAVREAEPEEISHGHVRAPGAHHH